MIFSSDGKFEVICRASSEETRAYDQSENEAKRKAAHLMMKLLRNSDSSEIREYEEMPSTADAVQFLQDNLLTKKRTRLSLPTSDPRSVFNLLQQQYPGMVEVAGLGKNDFKFSGSDHCRKRASKFKESDFPYFFIESAASESSSTADQHVSALPTWTAKFTQSSPSQHVPSVVKRSALSRAASRSF